MPVLILPTLGPFHLLQPRYNAQTLIELIEAFEPSELLLGSYGPDELAVDSWRDEEPAFFFVLPWARARGLPVRALDPQPAWRKEEELFRQALEAFPQGQTLLAQAQPLDEELRRALSQPLWPQELPRLQRALQSYLEGLRRLFGEGPATGHRSERMALLQAHLAQLPEGCYVLLVGALDYAELPAQGIEHTPTEAERIRALLDRAWRLEASDDLALLLEELRSIPTAESLYLAAQIYLAAGAPEAAFELMETLIQQDFSEPAYLPGYALARYGQLADLLGQRERALSAYRAVLALSWAPSEARDVAQAGLCTPFKVSPA